MFMSVCFALIAEQNQPTGVFMNLFAKDMLSPRALGAWNAIPNTISVGMTKKSSNHTNDGMVVSTSVQFLFLFSFKVR